MGKSPKTISKQRPKRKEGAPLSMSGGGPTYAPSSSKRPKSKPDSVVTPGSKRPKKRTVYKLSMRP